MEATIGGRLLSGAAGVLLLLGAGSKFLRPGDVIGAVSHVFTPVVHLGWGPALALVVLLICVEVSLGLLLLLRPTASVQRAAAIVYLLFALVLLVRFTAWGSPSCGCLSAWFTSKAITAVWFDIGRNVGLAAALWALAYSQASRPVSARVPSSHQQAAGFTLVELLVVLGVVALLLGIALPALARAREAGRLSASMQSQSQLLRALGAYSLDYKDFYPFLAPRENENDVITVHGVEFPYSFVTVHTRYWVYAFDGFSDESVRAAIGSAVPEAASPPVPLSAETGIPAARYWLTPAAAIDPSVFREPLATASQLPVEALHGMRHADVRQPSNKGILWDTLLMSRPGTSAVLSAAFADGSAAVLPTHTDPALVIESTFFAPRILVASTRDGLHGRDR